MTRFEYKTLYVEKKTQKGFLNGDLDLSEYEEKLNEMGKAGWELVNSYPIADISYGETGKIVSVFKRELE